MTIPRIFPFIPRKWEDRLLDMYCDSAFATPPKYMREFSLLTEWRSSFRAPPSGDWREMLPESLRLAIVQHRSEYIVVRGDSVFCAHFSKIPLDSFPTLHKAFLWRKAYATGLDAMDMEKKGAALMRNPHPSAQAIARFAADVSQWADDDQTKTGQKKWEDGEAGLINAFPQAAEALRRGDIAAAYDAIKQTPGARLTYGTKMLRMLSPQLAAGYDCILARPLLRYYVRAGYIAFCDDCQTIAAALNQRGVKNTFRKNGEWVAADAGAVLYHYFYLIQQERR